jgi:hypothetical protein
MYSISEEPAKPNVSRKFDAPTLCGTAIAASAARATMSSTSLWLLPVLAPLREDFWIFRAKDSWPPMNPQIRSLRK